MVVHHGARITYEISAVAYNLSLSLPLSPTSVVDNVIASERGMPARRPATP